MKDGRLAGSGYGLRQLPGIREDDEIECFQVETIAGHSEGIDRGERIACIRLVRPRPFRHFELELAPVRTLVR